MAFDYTKLQNDLLIIYGHRLLAMVYSQCKMIRFAKLVCMHIIALPNVQVD